MSDVQFASDDASMLSIVVEEPSYLQGYMSDEEFASSTEDDDAASLRSSFTCTSLDDDKFLEMSLSSSYDTATYRHCRKAEVVRLLPVGKIRVISVPRIVECSSPTRTPQYVAASASTLGSLNRYGNLDRTSLESDSERSSSDGYIDSSRSSHDAATLSTAPSTPREERTLPPLQTDFRRAVPRSVPLFEAAAMKTATSVASSSYGLLPTQGSLQTHATALPRMAGNDLSTTTAYAQPPRPLKPRAGRLPAALSLARLGLGRRNSTPNTPPLMTPRSRKETVQITDAPLDSPSFPHRSQSMRVKMVARGADEIEPTIVLPPCPFDRESRDDLHLDRLAQRDTALPPRLHRRSASSHFIHTAA